MTNEGISSQTPSTTQPQTIIPSALTQKPDPDGIKFFQEHSIPIVGTILLVLIGCLVVHFYSIVIDWSVTENFTSSVQNIVQVLAFLAGGWWAYFKFIKGRTFKESLVPGVRGKLLFIKDVQYLIVTTQIKNVGLSKIEFNREGSALIVFQCEYSAGAEIHTVIDNKLGSFDVLHENDRYIEPNELIEDQRFIALPGRQKLAYRLEVQITSTDHYTWRTATIVESSSSNDTMAAELIGL
jgi:hypothetical protein